MLVLKISSSFLKILKDSYFWNTLYYRVSPYRDAYITQLLNNCVWLYMFRDCHWLIKRKKNFGLSVPTETSNGFNQILRSFSPFYLFLLEAKVSMTKHLFSIKFIKPKELLNKFVFTSIIPELN